VTSEKNRALPDCSARERLILWPLCLMILWMGIGSPLFFSRTEKASTQVIEQMKRPQMPAFAYGKDAVPLLKNAPLNPKLLQDVHIKIEKK